MKIITTFAYILIALIMIYLSYHICYHSIQADHYQCKMYEEMKFINRVMDFLNFSDAKKLELQQLKDSYLVHFNQAKYSSWLFIALSLLILAGCLINVLQSLSMDSRLLLVRWIMFISILLLVIGIISPFLRIVMVNEKIRFFPFVLEYRTKSIATTIQHLSTSNFFLCLMIVICSIVIPVFKVLLTYLATHSKHTGIRNNSEFILKIIGKWAMTDVFVVAILLTFLSFDYTKCDLDFGFYYFTAYCILSFSCIFLIKNQSQNEMAIDDDDWDFD